MAADDSTSSSSADDDNNELPLKEIKSNTSHQELFDIKAILNKVNCPLSTKPEIPTKSSTEILSELFGAFNAEPPKIPDVVVKASVVKDSGVKPEKVDPIKKSKKSKKKHKHKDKKHKKSKHKKHSSNESNSLTNSSSRKRKHKHSSELKKKKIKKSNKDVCDVSVVENSPKGCDEEKQLTLVESVSVHNLAGDGVEVKSDQEYGPSLLNTVSSSDLDSGGKITDQVSEVKSVEGVKRKEINCDTKLEGQVQESSTSDPPSKSGEIAVDPHFVKTESDAERDLVDCLSVDVTKENEVKGSTPSVGEPCKSLQTGKFPAERCKSSTGKITIKNLKFSSVYEETVRQVEEQARLKAEKYEEGEISDSSANPSPSDHSAVEDIDGNDSGVFIKQESVVPGTVIVPDIDVPDDPVVDEKPKNVSSPSLVVELPNKKCHKSSRSSRHNHSVRTSSESRSCSQDRTSKKRSSSKNKSKKKRSHSKEKEPSHRSKEGRHSRRKDDVPDSSRQRSRSKDSHISSKKSNKLQDSSQHRSENKTGHRSRKRDRSHENSRHRSRSRDSWKRDRSRDNSQHRRNLPNNSRKERSRGRTRTRSRSRHRSRSRSRSGNHIDKQKLLEIARKNAMALLKQGALPSSVASQEKVVAIKAGGKSVAELTDFCKQLSKKEAMGSVSSDSGGEDRHHSSDSENERPFHHPFQIKERPSSIVLNIRNSVQLPVKTLQEKTAEQSKQLRIQFPVSSGQQHQKEWIPVSPKKEETLAVAKIPEPKVYPHLLPKGEVFPATANTEGLDIGSIVSQRLTAMRKLQENPNDSQALTEMYQAQKDMQVWAESKQQPGQFTGTTGVRVLTAAELSSGFQAWAKKDQLKEATPVSGGMGMTLLQKMGWRPGEGLGKNKEGTLEPLQLEVKMDKKGLVSQEELGQRLVLPHSQQQVLLQQQQQQQQQLHQQQQHQQQQQQLLQQQQQQQQMMQQQVLAKTAGKHPVSLLVELCSKRKWGAPHFELLFECGPDHRKNFLFRVRVDGVEYKPSVASPNKKQAKAEAATVCLQSLGVLPP
ncbi:protein Son isoform X2 [Anabrus simplex]|uniref:protein Son isoform X2 n=1 Tax=Anabrus simplex TaxID=316456 RepID=UPI0035A3236E